MTRPHRTRQNASESWVSQQTDASSGNRPAGMSNVASRTRRARRDDEPCQGLHHLSATCARPSIRRQRDGHVIERLDVGDGQHIDGVSHLDQRTHRGWSRLGVP